MVDFLGSLEVTITPLLLGDEMKTFTYCSISNSYCNRAKSLTCIMLPHVVSRIHPLAQKIDVRIKSVSLFVVNHDLALHCFNDTNSINMIQNAEIFQVL
jgi:hypothetical protein